LGKNKKLLFKEKIQIFKKLKEKATPGITALFLLKFVFT
jgi:hypothetical protein